MGNTVTDENTCTAFGYMHVPFRNNAQYTAAFNQFGETVMNRFWKTPGGIYSDSNQIGNLADCALNSDSDCASDLKSIDGGEWWFRNGGDQGFTERQPSGDYFAEC